MKISLSRASLVRIAGATILTAATLATGLPVAAQASPAAADDRDRFGERTVSVTVENETRETLRFSQRDSDVTEGEFSSRPSRFISPGRSGSFEAEANDRRGGVEGTVVYQTRMGDVEITFDNPSRGRGDYDCDAPRRVECDVDVDMNGREAELTVTVSRR